MTMADQIVLHGTLVLPDRIVPDGELVIEGQHIREVNSQRTRVRPTYSWQDGWILPGLIDLHIHGTAGCDVMDGMADALSRIDLALAQVGCTGYLATTMSASVENLEAVFRRVVEFRQHHPQSGMLGVHMEGPYIHPQRIGAQRADVVRNPAVDEVKRFHQILGPDLKRITMAPELPGAQALLQFCRSAGINVSLGHSNATFEEAAAAFDAGIHQVTHLFNAMTGIDHRAPGIAGAALMRPDVQVEVISDGVHVHPEILRLVSRLKGGDAVLLVTDAMRAALLADGDYDLGGQTISVNDGVARTVHGNLAGSTLTLMQAVFRYQAFAQVDLPTAVRAASLLPARAIGMGDRGALVPGFRADMALVDATGHNRMTWRRGQVIYDGC